MGDQHHLAVSTGRSFEDMLADPHEQFDARSELLASIMSYAAAPPASAGSHAWSVANTPGTHYAWLYAPALTGATTAA